MQTVFSAATYDSRTDTLWLAAGGRVFICDRSGTVLRYFAPVVKGQGGIPINRILVEGEGVLLSSYIHGIFEFRPPQ